MFLKEVFVARSEHSNSCDAFRKQMFYINLGRRTASKFRPRSQSTLHQGCIFRIQSTYALGRQG